MSDAHRILWGDIDVSKYMTADFDIQPLIPEEIAWPVIRKLAYSVPISHQLLDMYSPTRVEQLRQRRWERHLMRLDRRIRRAVRDRIRGAQFALGKAVLGEREYRLHRDCGDC